MSNIQCRECQADVSTGVNTCPHCGCIAPDKRHYMLSAAMVFLLILACIIAIVIWG